MQDANEKLSELRALMVKLQNLSEQLDPLETAYADVRFYDVDVEQTQQQYENLMSLMNNELHDESILNESVQQLAREIERLNSELSTEPVVCEQLEEVILMFQNFLFLFLFSIYREAVRSLYHCSLISWNGTNVRSSLIFKHSSVRQQIVD